jgi:LSD1 subclass zinc finger protein
VIVSCKQCGAPLDVAPSASKVRCRYCGTVAQVRKLATLHAQTPPGWVPPPAWTPPPAPDAPAAHLTAAHHAHVTTANVVVLATMIGSTLVLPAVIVLSGLPRPKSSLPPGDPPALQHVAQGPDQRDERDESVRVLVCKDGDVLQETGSTGVVRASGRCRLVLTDPKLEGKFALSVQGDAVVEVHVVKGASLDGAIRALEVEGRARVTLHGKVAVRGTAVVEAGATLVAPQAVLEERGYLIAKPGASVVGLGHTPPAAASSPARAPKAPPRPRAPQTKSPPKPAPKPASTQGSSPWRPEARPTPR